MMNPQPKISVIVPIYMIETYLTDCIQSIMKQTYTNLEIILVDDGSKDNCPQICDQMAEIDDRIIVIHKENGGLVSARKAGLKVATGEYATYVDGDDFIEPHYYETMMHAILTSSSDIVIAGYCRDYYQNSISFIPKLPEKTYEGEAIKNLYCEMLSYGEFYDAKISTYLWNKLFRRELLLKWQNIVDDTIFIGEDAAVIYPMLLDCQRIHVIHDTEYHYRQRADSMLKGIHSYNREVTNLNQLYQHLLSIFQKANPKYHLPQQLDDYILSLFLVRTGAFIRKGESMHFILDDMIQNKKIAIYSAGTFGQMLFYQLKKQTTSQLVSWYDEDALDYQKDGLEVKRIEEIEKDTFDLLIIASLSPTYIKNTIESLRLEPSQVCTFNFTNDLKKRLFNQYLLSK